VKQSETQTDKSLLKNKSKADFERENKEKLKVVA
jgi:hypothetical protein